MNKTISIPDSKNSQKPKIPYCYLHPAKIFQLSKIRFGTRKGVKGALFVLTDSWGTQQQAASADDGSVEFTVIPLRRYTLTENLPPAGYMPITVSYSVFIDIFDRIFVNDTPTPELVVENAPI